MAFFHNDFEWDVMCGTANPGILCQGPFISFTILIIICFKSFKIVLSKTDCPDAVAGN